MALVLNIDTATEVASVCVALNGYSVGFRKNMQWKEHASFVHVAVKSILDEANIRLKDVDAVAVTSGPGSYTGLRVGMAAAKGFCYAFSKPLVTANTLEVMAKAAIEATELNKNVLFCPMIDARRMEVFAALYDAELKNIYPPQPLILEEESFKSFITDRKIIFFGSGSLKFKEVMQSKNAVFENIEYDAKNLAGIAEIAFKEKKFTDISYSAPNYFKDFQSTYKF